LAFSASLAFEQSYGGIDGDSASCAEICCLLSALTNIPINQNLAITGSIDQHGRVQAIGGVNEKIEGFFDVCRHFGLTGDQGVIVPRANAEDLMLREDLVEAADQGQFFVYAIDDVFDALELLTGFPAGNREQGTHLPGTLLNIALEKAHEFWLRTLASPEALGRGKTN
jgi:ATP-dependent Lon protease